MDIVSNRFCAAANAAVDSRVAAESGPFAKQMFRILNHARSRSRCSAFSSSSEPGCLWLLVVAAATTAPVGQLSQTGRACRGGILLCSACTHGRREFVVASRYVTLRGRATHEYSKERIHSALGLGSPWRLVLCVHHTTRITMSSSLAGRFRPKSEMERLRRSLTLTACDLPRGLRSAAPRLSTSPCAASSLFETYCRLQSGIACAHSTGMDRWSRRSLTSAACVHLSGLRSAAPRLCGAPCAAAVER